MSSTTLQVHDVDGMPVAEPAAFPPGDPTSDSVDPDGYATGLRTATETEIGTRITATVGRRPTVNPCVATVLPTDYGVPCVQGSGADPLP